MHDSKGKERKDREKDHPEMWQSRLDEILDYFRSFNPLPQVICLQEFWFYKPFIVRFEEAMEPNYHIFYGQRFGKKEDGLATLILKNSPYLRTPKLVCRFPLAISDRVGLAVSATLTASDDQKPLNSNSRLLIVNAHLTFPHAFFFRRLREAQADSLTSYVDTYKSMHDKENVSTIVTGDFNSDMTSTVCLHMLSNGFVNCYSSINGPHAAPITHYNHLKQSVYTDHIFLSSSKSTRKPKCGIQKPNALTKRRSVLGTIGVRNVCNANSVRKQTTLRATRIMAVKSLSRAGSIGPNRDKLGEDKVAETVIPEQCAEACSISPKSAVVFPENSDPNVWPKSFNISDHRPVGVTFDVTCMMEESSNDEAQDE